MPQTDATADLAALLQRQRAAWRARDWRDAGRRIAALDALEKVVRANEQALVEAIAADFGQRPATETRLLEWMPLLDEIAHLRRHLRRWMRPRRVRVNWNFLPSRARIVPQPLGVVGIIGAWNYPLLLTLSPLANALAAGNHAMIKPSEHAPATAALLERMLDEAFAAEEVAVCPGDAKVSAAFAALPFDHLLFTGSTRIGREVMRAAADNLTPVTLELGGKSPALVHGDFDLAKAAERICTAKFWNAGQTCIAPDHVLLPQARMEEFARHCEAVIARHWPQPLRNPDYAHMASEAGHERMQALLEDARTQGARILQPGDDAVPESGTAGRAFPPTLVLDAHRDMRLMQEEIFGPVLPLVGYRDLDQALEFIAADERPLSLYYFDHDRHRIDEVLARSHAGGVTVNDCMYHFVQLRLPFGGVGASGIGAYHGKAGFERFSHMKPVLLQAGAVARLLTWLTKPPYGARSRRLLRWLAGSKADD
ncbi:coniferyl aldehyde dehydrogenase [Luteimonas sp. e5]